MNININRNQIKKIRFLDVMKLNIQERTVFIDKYYPKMQSWVRKPIVN